MFTATLRCAPPPPPHGALTFDQVGSVSDLRSHAPSSLLTFSRDHYQAGHVVCQGSVCLCSDTLAHGRGRTRQDRRQRPQNVARFMTPFYPYRCRAGDGLGRHYECRTAVPSRRRARTQRRYCRVYCFVISAGYLFVTKSCPTSVSCATSTTPGDARSPT